MNPSLLGGQRQGHLRWRIIRKLEASHERQAWLASLSFPQLKRFERYPVSLGFLYETMQHNDSPDQATVNGVFIKQYRTVAGINIAVHPEGSSVVTVIYRINFNCGIRVDQEDEIRRLVRDIDRGLLDETFPGQDFGDSSSDY